MPIIEFEVDPDEREPFAANGGVRLLEKKLSSVGDL
jgi:hypothetical protein